MSYQEYPKVMKHPKHAPATIYRQPRYKPGEEGWGRPVDPGQTGKPEQFPDVMVNNPDQEMDYAAKGYVPFGVSDPEAYRRAITGNEPRDPNTFAEYPRMLYKKIDGKVQNKVVRDSDEHDAAADDGWHTTHTAAQTGEPPAKPSTDNGDGDDSDKGDNNEAVTKKKAAPAVVKKTVVGRGGNKLLNR